MDASTKIVSDEEIIDYLKKQTIQFIEYQPAKIIYFATELYSIKSNAYNNWGIKPSIINVLESEDAETIPDKVADDYPKYRLWGSNEGYRNFDFEELIEFVKLAIIADRNANVKHG